MEHTTTAPSPTRYQSELGKNSVDEANSSGVSWAAVIGGAFVAAALSLILLALGTGIGFSAVSPWTNAGASAATIGGGAIVWLILMQIISASMGGYLAGRLRTKWSNIHSDEVYFRDTAHGFLAWAVATVITAAFLASAAAAMLGVSASSGSGGTGMTTSAQSVARDVDPNGYFVDTLFRSDHPNLDSNAASVRGEAGRVFANALRQGEIPAKDKAYLTELIVARTGLSQADAQNRVSEVFAAAQQAADVARKTVAHSLLWAFLALLIGAFCASLAATIGGRQRDHVFVV
jgi:hypothetical protein